MWYLTRSTGIVAAVLAVASLVWGLFFSARNTGTRLKPNWWLALHNYLGGLTLVFVGIHMLVSFLDTDAGLRLRRPVVCPAARSGWAIGWGVVAFWLFVIVVLPSIARIRRRLPRKAWHACTCSPSPPSCSVRCARLPGRQRLDVGVVHPRPRAAHRHLAVYPLTIRLLGIAQRRRAAL
jgi:hypothetical protein